MAVLAVMLLFRVAAVPAWNCLYAEDYQVFLVSALAHPWHLAVPYRGYLELIQRLLAQAISLLPLTWAAFAFAVAGALIAGSCALFTFHASAGYIRSRSLRAVLALSLILLPIAPLELAGDGVNTPWYLMIALFWAVLWRPRSRAGQAASALVAFAVVTSSPLAILFTPLLAMRVLELRSVREHAVTIGWLLGWPLQLYGIAQSYASHTQRVSSLAPAARSVTYYLHTVVLRAFGWHVSWHLVRALGTSRATLLCAAVLVVLLALVWLAGSAAVRAFVLVAVTFGFVVTVVAAMVTNYVVNESPVLYPVSFEPGSRYSALPLALFDAALIAGADSFASRYGEFGEAAHAVLHGVVPAVLRGRFGAVRRGPRPRPGVVLGVTLALLCVLGLGWVTDYRYLTQRTTNGPWRPVAVRDLDYCRNHETIRVSEWTGQNNTNVRVRIPCSRLVR